MLTYRWKRPALKKYGETRPDFSVKVPNVRTWADRQAWRKLVL